MDKSYAGMSLEELEAENIRLSNERKAIKAKQDELTKLIDAKLHEKTIANKIKNMGNDEIVAMYNQLKQVVGVNAAGSTGVANNG